MHMAFHLLVSIEVSYLYACIVVYSGLCEQVRPGHNSFHIRHVLYIQIVCPLCVIMEYPTQFTVYPQPINYMKRPLNIAQLSCDQDRRIVQCRNLVNVSLLKVQFLLALLPQ